MSKFVLPKIWFLELETKEMFDELCLPYQRAFNFYTHIGITNDGEQDITNCGKYYYIDNIKTSIGERITYQQFKQYVLKEKPKRENLNYLKILFKKLQIK